MLPSVTLCHSNFLFYGTNRSTAHRATVIVEVALCAVPVDLFDLFVALTLALLEI